MWPHLIPSQILRRANLFVIETSKLEGMLNHSRYVHKCGTGVTMHQWDKFQSFSGNIGGYILPGTPVIDEGIQDINRGIRFPVNQLPPLATVEVDETTRATGLISFGTRTPFYENVSWAHVSV